MNSCFSQFCRINSQYGAICSLTRHSRTWCQDRSRIQPPLIREGTFFIGGGGGWVGASEGRVSSKFLTNWGGSNLFYSQLGKGHSFFLAREKIRHVSSLLQQLHGFADSFLIDFKLSRNSSFAS